MFKKSPSKEKEPAAAVHTVVQPPPITTDEYFQKITEAANFVREKLGPADVGVVLGSGLGMFKDYLTGTASVGFEDIPHMPRPTVAMHSGTVIAGMMGGKRIHLYVGRLHWYEGHMPHIVTFATRIIKEVGAKVIMLTNAAGGSQAGMYVGCPMVITDHVNLHLRSPLGDNSAEDPRLSAPYVETKDLYSKRLIDLAKETALELDQPLFNGVYCMTTGPLFETPTETRTLTDMGVSAFGMSTVPECCTAHSLGLEVFAMSMITNLAAGYSENALSHEEVGDAAKAAGPKFAALLKTILEKLTLPDTVPPTLAAPGEKIPILSPLFSMVSRDAAQEAADSLHDLKESCDLAIVLAPQHAPFLDRLHGKVEWRLSALANMPQNGSRSGRWGKLVYGRTAKAPEGHGVFCVLTRRQEGFEKDEAGFVVNLLRCLGVQHIGTTLVGISTNGATKLEVGSVLPVTEWSNATTANYAAGTDFPLKVFTSPITGFISDTFKTNVPPTGKTKMFCCGGESGSNTPQLCYRWHQGPTMPSPAEVAISKYYNCHVIGICGLHAPLTASMDGLQTFGLVSVQTREQVVECLPVEESPLYEILTAVIDNFSHPCDCPKSRLSVVRDETTVPAPVLVERNQTTFQHPIAHTTAAADYVLATLGISREDPPVTLVVKKNMEWLNLHEDYIEKKTTVDYSDIPYMPPHITARSTKAKLVYGQYNSNKVLLVYGVVNSGEGSPSDTGFVIRMLGRMGIKTMIVIGTVFGNDPAAMHNGDLVLISDHLAATGWNPLFGKNEDQYGLRFNDMGQGYDPSLRATAVKAAEVTGVKLTVTKMAAVNGRIHMSESEAEFAMQFGMGVTCSSIFPEIQIGHHHSMRKAAMCMVDMGEGASFEEFSSALNPTSGPVAHLHQYRAGYVNWLWKTLELYHAEQ